MRLASAFPVAAGDLNYRGGMRCNAVQALAWRLGRQYLDPIAAVPTTEVVRRLLALRGWPEEGSDLAVCVRQADPDPGGVGRALDAGELIRSYAFRGGSYVFVPEVAAVVLSVRTATRVWEKRRWQDQGNFALDDWEPLRDALCAALADGPMTRQEIAQHLIRIPALRHLTTGARGAGGDSLYKPLHWWGDICFGPARDGVSTFRLLRGDPRWPGLPSADDAGREAIRLYLSAYGPATWQNLGYWLNEGLGAPRRVLQAWLADLDNELTTIEVDGREAFLLERDVDFLAATEPSDAVQLLPAFDPWLLGPGTADPMLVASRRRALFSRGAQPVIWRGVVAGTWRLERGTVAVSWFPESGPPPTPNLTAEVDRLTTIRASDPGVNHA